MKYRLLLAAVAATVAMMPVEAGAEYAAADDGSLSGSYLAGRSASSERDNDLASDYFARALLGDPDNPVLIEKVFLLRLSEGDVPGAEEFAARVIDFNSQQRMARIVLGLRDIRENRHAKARENFREAAYTPVGELTSAMLTAWSHAAEGNLAPALKTLDRLDTYETLANFKSFHAALIADFLSNHIRAEASYAKAYEQAGTSLRVVQAYGNYLERQGRPAEAIKVYEAFLDGSGDNPLIESALGRAKKGSRPDAFVSNARAGVAEALLSLATSMTDEQSIDVGLLYAQLALGFAADKSTVYTLLGDIYEDTKRYDKAIDAYEQVSPASPLRQNADIQVAVNLHRLDRTGDAQDRLNAVLSRDPANYDALVTLGNIHRNNETYDKAAEAYDRAIALLADPAKQNWRVYYYRGIANERQKQWEKAEADFRKALTIAPDEPLVLNYLGYSMIEKKINLAEALGMVKKAVELKPNDGYIVDSLGWAYYQLGDYNEALVHLERAVELNPSDPVIGEHLGDVYWKVGRRLEAKFQWQHAKDNKPIPEDLKRIEDKLLNGMADDGPPVTPAQNGSGQNNG